MRNILNLALSESLWKHSDDQERMLQYYQAFAEAEQDTMLALGSYADLVFDYAVFEDVEQSHITPAKVIGMALNLKNLYTDLSLAQTGRENADRYLTLLQEGGE